MPNEYDDPVHANAIASAVALSIELAAQYRSLSADELAQQAVDLVFCTCVTSAADAVAKGRAPVHAGLISEVRQQAERRGIYGAAGGAASEVVDRASEKSFPASDPPAWIWR
jgi:hypothetical protein